MRSALSPPAADPHFVSHRRRAVAFVLACAIPALIVLMLLRLAVFTPAARPPRRAPVIFDLAPEPQPEPNRSRARAAAAGGGAPPRRPVPAATPRPAPPPAPLPTPTPAPPLDIIPLSREDFAAADIGRIARPTPAADGGAGDGGAGSSGRGTGRGSSQKAGTGPGGVQLYAAEWVREPTHAELDVYVGNRAPDGAWAEIACRTLPGFRVDLCQEIGQFPSGLGLAGAIRQAAWQFRIRPPRIDGKPVVGSYVRIRVDFTRAER